MQDIIYLAVVALADNGIDAVDRHIVRLAAVNGVLNQSVPHEACIQCICQGDGGFQGSQLADLHQPAALAKAIVNVRGCCVF